MLVSQAIYKNIAPIFKSRIWPNAAPEDAASPFMVYTEDSSEKLNTLSDGFINHSKSKVQMYIFSKDYNDIKRLKDEVILAMTIQTDLASCIVISDQYQFETQTDSHLIVIEFSMWEQTE